MKILFFSDDFPPYSFGGAGISTYELAVGIKKAGHEVFVITTVRKESEAGEDNFDGLKVFKIASDYPERWRAYLGLYNRQVLRKLENILDRVKPDVVHANNIHYYLSYHSLKVAKKYAKVVVMTFRDTMAFSYGKLETKKYLENFDCRITWFDNLKQAKKRWNPLRNFIIRQYLQCANKLFSVSNALTEALKKNGIIEVETIHTGINVSAYKVSQDAVVKFKTKYGLAGKKALFWGGRLSASKGASAVLEVMNNIVKKFPNAVLLITGNAGIYADYAKKLEIKNSLRFTGWIGREEIKLAYAVADVVLVPSLCLDPFPRINLEAMASAKTLVGTCYGGTPEIIHDGVTGYVVNPFNTKEMTEKIIDLLKNSEKAERFGMAGYKRVKTYFNLDDKVARTLFWYNNLLNSK